MPISNIKRLYEVRKSIRAELNRKFKGIFSYMVFNKPYIFKFLFSKRDCNCLKYNDSFVNVFRDENIAQIEYFHTFQFSIICLYNDKEDTVFVFVVESYKVSKVREYSFKEFKDCLVKFNNTLSLNVFDEHISEKNAEDLQRSLTFIQNRTTEITNMQSAINIGCEKLEQMKQELSLLDSKLNDELGILELEKKLKQLYAKKEKLKQTKEDEISALHLKIFNDVVLTNTHIIGITKTIKNIEIDYPKELLNESTFSKFVKIVRKLTCSKI